MKRLIVIGTLIVATLQASPAFAEVTWVLWGQYVFSWDDRQVEWAIIDTYTTKPACEDARDKLSRHVQEQSGGGYKIYETRHTIHIRGRTYRFIVSPYQCLPDTVDPRPKQ